MDLLAYFRRQFAYDAWANTAVLAAIRTSGNNNPKLLVLMSHILSAERLWLERLKNEPQTQKVWPDSDLDQCELQAKEMALLWSEYLATLSPERLVQEVSYKNSKGEPWSSTVQDILTHVVMHAAYHRGQIASSMRADGQTPVLTDFIHAVRQGFVE